jgi:hypothetical protein
MSDVDRLDLDPKSYCDICGHEIHKDQAFSDHPDYGLCHKDCVDAADNGPEDEPWEPSPRDEHGRRP